MGTVSDKLTYLNTTKGKIKDSINLTGANLTNETFRQYATVLKDTLAHLLKNPSPIWDNFPKITQTGTAIQVNTYDSLLDYSLLGDTTQNGTPTPTKPIPINVVTGLQEIEACGKNLLPQDKYIATTTKNGVTYTNNGDGTFNLVGTATANTVFQIITYDVFGLEVNQPYYLYSSIPYNATTFNMSIPMTVNGATRYLLANSTYTPTSKPTLVRLQFSVASGNSVNATNVRMMLVKGNTAPTEYEPYKGNTYEINLGKNLIKYPYSDTTKTTNGLTFTDNGDGSITINGTSTGQAIFYLNNNGWSFNNSSVLPTGTYAFNKLATNNNVYFYINIYKNDGTNQTYLTSTGNTTFNITETQSLNMPRIVVESGVTLNNVRVYPQLEKGSQVTSYSPYFTPIELCEINDYKDLIFKGKGINLFDKNNVRAGYRLTDSGYYADNGYNATEFIEVKPSTTYSTSWTMDWSECVCTYDINQTFVRRVMSGTGFTTSGTEYYIRADVKDAHLSTAQINEGNQVLPYEPYNAKDKWLLHKEIGKLILGNANYIYNSSNKRFYNTFSDINLFTPTDTSRHVEYIKAYCFNNSTTDADGTIFQYQNQLIMHNYNYTDTTDFKNWLSNINAYLYYILQNPTTEEITNSELLEQLNSLELLDGLNNIAITGYLPAIMSLTCLEKE